LLSWLIWFLRCNLSFSGSSSCPPEKSFFIVLHPFDTV
jgi:hypothetical protein